MLAAGSLAFSPPGSLASAALPVADVTSPRSLPSLGLDSFAIGSSRLGGFP